MNPERTSDQSSWLARRRGSGSSHQQSHTWKTSSTAESDKSPALQYIILVHGFGGSKSSFRQCLKQWRRERNAHYAQERACVKVKRFKFDMDGVLRDHRGLEEEANKLLGFVKTLEDTPLSKRRPGSRSSYTHDEAVEENENVSEMPAFVFAAHSLGVWVVRNCFNIARQRGLTILANTIGVVEIDVPERSNFGDQADYRRYLEQIGPIFGLKSQGSGDFVKALETIDQSYDAARTAPHDNHRYRHAECFELWVTEQDLKQKPMNHLERRFRSSVQAWWRRQRDEPRVAKKLLDLSHCLEQVRTNTLDGFKDPALAIHAEDTGTTEPQGALETGPASQNPSQQLAVESRPEITSKDRPMSYLGPIGNEIITLPQPMPSDSIIEAELANLLSLAFGCLEEGELGRADKLLGDGERMLELVSKDPQLSADETILVTQKLCNVRVQHFVVQIHLGRYKGLKEDGAGLLEYIQEFASKYKSGEQGYLKTKAEAERWVCRATLLYGDYRQAAKGLEDLLGRQGVRLPPERNTSGQDGDTIFQNRNKILLRRDLAIANAHLGNFQDCKSNIQAAKQLHRELFDTVSVNIPSEIDAVGPGSDHTRWADEVSQLKGIQDSIHFTEASIEFLCGNYRQALKMVRIAVRGMVRHFGQTHLRTLESAKLNALLLALNSDIVEAEGICRHTLQVMTTELGTKHPQTLETMSILVFIFRTQGRLVEAVNMSRSVCKTLEDALSRDHPRALEARVELAANYRSAGNYVLAQKELEDVANLSLARYRARHPSTLRYLSELTHAYYRSGYFVAAEELGLDVLTRQRKLYTLQRPRPATRGEEGSAEPDGRSLEHFTQATGALNPGEFKKRSFSQTKAFIKEILGEIHFEYAILEAINTGRAQYQAYMEQSQQDPQHDRSSDDAHYLDPHSTAWVVEKEMDLRGRLAFLEKYQQRVDQATSEIESAKAAQQAEYQHSQAQGTSESKASEIQEEFLNRLKDIQARHSQLTVHPNYLHTLQILASILLQKDAPQELLAEDIFFTIWRWRVETLGSSNSSTLLSEFKLATSLRQRKKLREAQYFFYEVCMQRLELLGEIHPDTLSARLELTITKCAAGEWEEFDAKSMFSKKAIEADISMDENDELPTQYSDEGDSILQRKDKEEGVEFYSRDILRSQEAHLGKLHPEALKTLLWVFIVQLDSTTEGQESVAEADATARTILQRLRDPEVREQRCLESIQMEDKIAKFFEAYDYQKKGADIRDMAFLESERKAQDEVERAESFVRDFRIRLSQDDTDQALQGRPKEIEGGTS